MTIRKIRLSRISALHYYKLFFRSALFLGALILYVLHRMGIIEDSASAYRPYVLGTIALIFIAEMILRFFPSSFESMGCQKQFKRNFIPTDVSRPRRRSPLSILAVAAAWIGLMTSAISGTPTNPMAPPKPPLDRPTRTTAGSAVA